MEVDVENDYFDIVEEAVECLCDTLFACNSRLCVFEDENEVICPIRVVMLGHNYAEIPTEEKTIAREETDFLVQCDWLQEKGYKDLPTCTKIYCKSKLCVEVYEIQKEVGRTPSMKHDEYGFCFRIAASKCGELESDQWQSLLGRAQNSNSQNASQMDSHRRTGRGTFRL